MSELSDLGKAAVWYCEHGFGIIPIVPRGKAPFAKFAPNGLNSWFDNPDDARKMWEIQPDLNIGIVCGTPSHGLLVFDLDTSESKDGIETLRNWQVANGELPETAMAITGSGGRHYLFRTERTTIRPSVNHTLCVDVRCDGSYIVAPPSVHPSGELYTWWEDPRDTPVANANGKVYDFLDYVQRNGSQDENIPAQTSFQLPDRIKSGERNDVLYRYGCSLRSRGYPDEAIEAMLEKVNREHCATPVSHAELETIVRQVCKHGPGHDGEGTMRGEDVGIGAPGRSEQIHLATNSKGGVLQTTANMLLAIRHDANLTDRLWYDSIAFTRMVTCPLPWDGREGERALTDEDYTGLTAYLEHTYGLTSKERIIDACQFVCRKNERNTVVEWLDSLVWDGENRIGSLIVYALGADDTPYTREVERLFMLGAVARAYHPGCKYDYMPVLVGPQGIGKSKYVSLLAHIPAWYDDNFNTIDGDAAIEKLRGLWIAEMAELLATKKAREVEAIKAFITSTKDVIRPKYARETVQRLRVCVFIGTTNDHDFLTDSTGNRRFLPVECNATTCNEWMFTEDAELYVEQMWAEAVHVYKTEGPSLVLSRPLQDTALALQEAHTEERPIMAQTRLIVNELLPEKSADAYIGTASERICTREVFLRLPDDMQRGGFNQLVRRDIAAGLDADERLARMRKKQRTQCYGVVNCWVPVRERLWSMMP